LLYRLLYGIRASGLSPHLTATGSGVLDERRM
jgi:hypothetical protein